MAIKANGNNTQRKLFLFICLASLPSQFSNVFVNGYVLDNNSSNNNNSGSSSNNRHGISSSSLTSTTTGKSQETLPQVNLASRLIMQSPSLDNVYKDFVVTSKPLTLRKYKNGQKIKKTKKDSKIYYIPIPPLPYRYIPGVGYDYQPMKIKPIMQEMAAAAAAAAQQTPQTTTSIVKPPQQQYLTNIGVGVGVGVDGGGGGDGGNILGESKIIRLQQMKNNKKIPYYFNGRPFRLQAAHAGRRHQQLTPTNLKSNFYFNKNIIY